MVILSVFLVSREIRIFFNKSDDEMTKYKSMSMIHKRFTWEEFFENFLRVHEASFVVSLKFEGKQWFA